MISLNKKSGGRPIKLGENWQRRFAGRKRRERRREIKAMLRYTAKRFLSMVVTFFLMHASPGQPFEVSRETPESV